jgi:serine/threonine-protein kinase HipA
MTSKPRPAPARPPSARADAYVWIWLPGTTEPVVAGRLARESDRLIFNYGQSYLARQDAVAIYVPELPLQRGALVPEPGLSMAGCLRDGAPDAWGRRVILNKTLGLRGRDANVEALDELTYLLESGSDRIGALDFQLSPTDYVRRGGRATPLQELLHAAEKVDAGTPLLPELDQALFHGSSLGGARPKAIIDDGEHKLIAKFSSSSDTHDVVKAEFVAMRLAARVGLDVAPVRLEHVAGKDVLLVERFDRIRIDRGIWQRKAMVSALTLFGLDEMMARYASYADLTEIVRHRFNEPRETLRELFGRLVFNILCGNTDDHARNHAAFWDGERLTLTPAYDICPQNRSGNEASQAMLIVGEDRRSRLATCLDAAPSFMLDTAAAEDLITRQIRALRKSWDEVMVEAQLSEVERRLLQQRIFLNPFIFEDAPPRLQALQQT